MLLQPLVENAIKHGLEPKVGAGSIEIEAARRGAFIELRVNDSGLGLPADGDPSSSTGTSYGLQHVRDRLRVTYGPAAELRLERRAPSGVSAVIRLPA
jgi:sensor histidine kinase YesM